ncbi:ABC transporter substrate-binding protein [Actinoplanes sp. RD1]|uniref:ABC transporter substrate-binding protein n=1 Tax=Actinoplanes sp. RD1 TaxID=3064538 RepID=UPI002741E6F5|nr:ABC transporter substrate-binding protein [Actinoplanes sp. RD1]
MPRPAHTAPSLLAVTLALVTACSGGGGGGAGAAGPADQLRLAVSADLPTLDPDTVYQYEGNQILNAVYEGLLSYAGDSTAEIVPALASKYEVSPDGLTYTFTLRDDVTFADGRKMTSADVRASFERLADEKVASQMAYMVAGIGGYATPDDGTFVVTLKAPSSSFLSLVASPFGPKVIDGDVLKDNAADSATAYLKEHTAGTGPYEVASMTKGQGYELARNDDYWGGSPSFAKVSVKVIADAATRLLQLQGGDLDVVTGQPVATVDQFAKTDGYQVAEFPTLQKAQLHLKVTGALADAKLRVALRAAIDRDAFVRQIFGTHATASTQMYPVTSVPDTLAKDAWTTDPSGLKALAAGKSLTLGYISGQARDKQAAEALQAQWAAAGATVDLTPIQGSDIYGFSSALDTAPDMIYESSYPDSTHPDTWARLFWYSDTAKGNGALNYLVGGTKEADAAIDAGAAATAQEQVDAAYGKAGDLVAAQASYITLADMKDSFIMRGDLTGAGHWLPAPMTLDLRTIKRAGAQ